MPRPKTRTSPPPSPDGEPTERAILRKRQILDVASDVFHTRGFHAARMDDVAAETGLNKATIYYYFPRKSDILYELYLESTDDILSRLELHPLGLSPIERLKLIVHDIIVRAAERPKQVAVYFQEQPFLHEWLEKDQMAELERRERKFLAYVQDVIEAGIDDGSFIAEDPRLLALAVIGMAAWPHRWFRPRRGGLRPNELADLYATVLLNGFAAQPAKRAGR